jgi:ribonuclease HI
MREMQKTYELKEVLSVRILGPSLTNKFGGFACYAYVIRNKKGQLIHEACGLCEKPNAQSATSSNVAAYTALIRALEWLIRHGYKDDIIVVKASSKPLIFQLDEVYQSPHHTGDERTDNSLPKSIIPFYLKALKLKSRFYKLSFELVESKENNLVDDTIEAEERKEIEELLVMAYVDAEARIMKQNRIFPEQKSPFVTAAQLMKYRTTHLQAQ